MHLFDFSSLCVFKCVLKLLTWEDAKLHWLHLFDFFHCVFLNVPSNCLHRRMQNHIGCTCLIFYLGPFFSLSLEVLFWHCFHPHYDFQNLDTSLSSNKQAKEMEKEERLIPALLLSSGNCFLQIQINFWFERKMKVKLISVFVC